MKYSRLDLLPRGLDLSQGLVVDVGANRGDWTSAIRRLIPDARLVAIEPDPRPRKMLKSRFGSDPYVEILEAAVGSSAGEMPFFMTKHDHASSLLRPTDQISSQYVDDAAWKVEEEIRVNVLSLDQLVAERPVSLLKIDVQGGEAGLIEGGENTLRSAGALIIEMVFSPHYEGDATFFDLHDKLTSFGLQLHGLSVPFRGRSEEIMWVDACYARLINS